MTNLQNLVYDASRYDTTGGDEAEGLGIDPIVQEAKRRWQRCSEWESPSRERFIDDIRFENGDSDNGYQWPNAIRRAREVDSRPVLTMNIIRQHNLQISNQMRKNKSSVKYVPQGNGATVESAQIMRQLAMRIEQQSDAQDAYTVARNFQIGGGVGYWRIVTDYVSWDTFDQDVYILPVKDPLSVYLDPDIKKKDGSDANFGFVFDNMPMGIFKEKYPEFADTAGHSPLTIATGDDDWVSKDYVRVCEYYRKVGVDDTLMSFVWQGERKTILSSKLPSNVRDAILRDPTVRTRQVQVEKIEWYLIAGEHVIDSTIWIGKTIPIVRVIGEETVIDGVMDRKGHTRWMKDAQRMFNYNASSQVEFVALQGKTPWVADVRAIEEHESMWNTANTANHSVLVYNGVDDEGQEIKPPSRTPPPTASPAYQAGMDTAFNQMMMTSGQFQNQMGMMGNERTGAAIQGRQQQSETAVYHFQDNYEDALIYTGKILLDLIPKVYDTKRVLRIQAEDQEDFEVLIDPQAKQAFEQKIAANGLAATRIFNPSLGLYDVVPAVGPSMSSKRQQTAEALTLVLTQAPDLIPVIGDLLISSMDFDKAQEAAQRLRRMVPPAALGQGPTPNEQRLMQANQALQQSLTQSLQSQAKNELKLVGKDQMRDIDVYKAQTDRLKALGDQLPLDPDGLMQIIHELVEEAMQSRLSPIIEANSKEMSLKPQASPEGDSQHPGVTGARKAPDGQWYVEHPMQPGKFMKVVPNTRS